MKAKKIILAGALLTSVLLTACGTKVEESESETTGKTEPAENVATEESDTQQVTASAEDGYYLVYAKDGEKYKYHFYTESGDCSQYYYSFRMGEASGPLSSVKASKGEVNLENFDNGAETSLEVDGISISHYDFDAVKDEEVSENFTYADMLEKFPIDTILFDANNLVEQKADDYSSEDFDYQKNILEKSHYEVVSIRITDADEFEDYTKPIVQVSSGDTYTADEYEINGYPVIMQIYERPVDPQILRDTDKPVRTDYRATVKLSDKIFVQAELSSAKTREEADALLQKYVIDAID